MAHGDFSKTPTTTPGYFTCTGGVGQPCGNPLHRGAVVRVSPTCFLLTCQVGDAYEGEGIDTCALCAEPAPKSVLLAGNPALRALLLERNNELVRPNFGSTLPPEVARLMATLLAKDEAMVCAPCAEPGLAQLREKGGFVMNGGMMLPFEQPPAVKAAPAPVAPGGVVKYTPPAAKVGTTASRPQPPAVKAGPAMPPRLKAVAVPATNSGPVTHLSPQKEQSEYWSLAEFAVDLVNGKWVEFGGTRWDGERKLTQCVLNKNAPDHCRCGGWHDWHDLVSFRRVNREGKPSLMGFGATCADLIDGVLKEIGREPAFGKARISLAVAMEEVTGPPPARRGERFEGALRAAGPPPRSAEDLAQAAADRLERERKLAARRAEDAERRRKMKGKSGGGGSKKKNDRK